MKLEKKLQLLRKKKGFSREQLADKLGVSRQTIGKWENGQAIPELLSIIQISKLYGVTIDKIVKEDDECNIRMIGKEDVDMNKTIAFLMKAKQNTYAGYGKEIESSRLASHDFVYQEGEYLYYDTYLGGECFSGEEAIWHHENPIWCMNYSGRVTGDNFSGDFLKEALSHVPEEIPYRGPEIYKKGDYTYHCKVDGEFIWYQGYEDIFYCEQKIYECFFHGGIVK